jgi:hypothetical protein
MMAQLAVLRTSARPSLSGMGCRIGTAATRTKGDVISEMAQRVVWQTFTLRRMQPFAT